MFFVKLGFASDERTVFEMAVDTDALAQTLGKIFSPSMSMS
jgi:hypothetical protein